MSWQKLSKLYDLLPFIAVVKQYGLWSELSCVMNSCSC